MRALLFPRNLPRLLPGAVLLLLLVGPASARDDIRVVLEGGAIRPLSELGAEYAPGQRGLGQSDGFEIGLGLRVPVADAWTVSPGFHYVDFGRHEWIDEAEEAWRTEAISLRTTAELMWCPPARRGPLRPLLAVGGGLYRNRVVGYYDDPESTERDDTVNSFGYYVRWGIRSGALEISFLAHRNVVRTWRYFEGEKRGKYGWHGLAVRVSYLLPW